MTIIEKIYAYGHQNISCTHKTTIEVTKDKYITRSGTCILATNASKACFDLNDELKRMIFYERKIKVKIQVDNISDTFFGFGHKNLKLLSHKDLVFRKSDYICDRTVLIKCSKSSNDLDNNIIEKIKNPQKKILILFEL
ncbi:MAG: DUF371 domain-containing protein [Candidatus Heimdallarchaeota archaeon]